MTSSEEKPATDEEIAEFRDSGDDRALTHEMLIARLDAETARADRLSTAEVERRLALAIELLDDLRPFWSRSTSSDLVHPEDANVDDNASRAQGRADMSAGGADHEMFREAPEDGPVAQARALLWSYLDDLSHRAQAQTCQQIVERLRS